MNSTNFYDSLEFKYPEIAVCIEDIESDASNGKFFIPVLTPSLSPDEPYDKKEIKVSKINILNREDVNLDISLCVESNYILLDIPDHIRGQYNKGDRFVISFIGGDINKPYILGRYR